MKKRPSFISFLISLFSQGQFWFLKILMISFLGIQPVVADEDLKELIRDSLKSGLKIMVDKFEKLENENFIDPEAVADIANKITVRIEGATQGSGVLVKKKGNIYTVLTSWHVLKDIHKSEEVEIITFDGMEHSWESKSVRKVGQVDMAVLNFKSKKNYEIANFGNLNEISMGTNSYVAGFPLSSTSVPIRLLRFTKGEVIANANTKIPDGYQLLYSNLTLPGMSGGGVFNSRGELIGIHGRAELAIINEQGKLIASGTNQGVPIKFYEFFSKGKIIDYSGTTSPSIDDYFAQIRSILYVKGNEKQVIKIANKVLALEETPKAYYFRGYAKYELGDFYGVIYDMDKAIEIDNKSANSFIVRGVAKSSLNDDLGAIKDFTNAIEINPYAAGSYINRGLSYRDLGDYFAAMSDLSKAIELDSNFSEKAYYNRGYTRMSLVKDYEGAISDYTKAIELNPKKSKAFNNRGLAKNYLGDYEGAIEDLTKAIELNPSDAMHYSNRGIVKRASGNYEGAIEDYTKAIKTNPKYHDAYFNRGALRGEHFEDYRGAIADFTKAIEFKPNLSIAYDLRAQYKIQVKDYYGAIEDYTKAIERDPLNPKLLHNRGSAKQDYNDHENAIRDFNRAIDLEKDSSILYHYYNNLAWSKYKIGKYKDALLDINQSIILNNEYSNAFDTRGHIKYELKDFEGACADMKKSISLGGDFSKEWLNQRGELCK